MSCLQNCCAQELDPFDLRTSVDFEPELTANGRDGRDGRDGPNGPNDDGPKGLGAMCSVNMALGAGESDGQETLGRASFQSSVSGRIRETDLEILRGMTLRESLCRGASVWRMNPEQLL